MNSLLKSIIIDDEKLAREIIKKYLENFPGIELAAECSNGFDGIKAISEHKPDIIFLDIQMPKLSGFEMLELLEEKPVIIFTTAFDQYAIKAFEVNATDYLLKPFSPERFKEAVDKALVQLKDKKSYVNEIDKLVQNLDGMKQYLERVVVKSGLKISIIPVDKLFYLEAQDDYVMLHTNDGKHLIQKTMKYFEEHLNPRHFVRIHRSYIVKLSKVKQIELLEKETYTAVLLNGVNLPISKSGYSLLKEIIH